MPGMCRLDFNFILIGKTPVYAMTQFDGKVPSCLSRLALARRRFLVGRMLVRANEPADAVVLFVSECPLIVGRTMTLPPCCTEWCIIFIM